VVLEVLEVREFRDVVATIAVIKAVAVIGPTLPPPQRLSRQLRLLRWRRRSLHRVRAQPKVVRPSAARTRLMSPGPDSRPRAPTATAMAMGDAPATTVRVGRRSHRRTLRSPLRPHPRRRLPPLRRHQSANAR
jgi:hypothetical protein